MKTKIIVLKKIMLRSLLLVAVFFEQSLLHLVAKPPDVGESTQEHVSDSAQVDAYHQGKRRCVSFYFLARGGLLTPIPTLSGELPTIPIAHKSNIYLNGENFCGGLTLGMKWHLRSWIMGLESGVLWSSAGSRNANESPIPIYDNFYTTQTNRYNIGTNFGYNFGRAHMLLKCGVVFSRWKSGSTSGNFGGIHGSKYRTGLYVGVGSDFQLTRRFLFGFTFAHSWFQSYALSNQLMKLNSKPRTHVATMHMGVSI